jgi:hypothetical protein
MSNWMTSFMEEAIVKQIQETQDSSSVLGNASVIPDRSSRNPANKSLSLSSMSKGALPIGWLVYSQLMDRIIVLPLIAASVLTTRTSTLTSLLHCKEGSFGFDQECADLQYHPGGRVSLLVAVLPPACRDSCWGAGKGLDCSAGSWYHALSVDSSRGKKGLSKVVRR